MCVHSWPGPPVGLDDRKREPQVDETNGGESPKSVFRETQEEGLTKCWSPGDLFAPKAKVKDWTAALGRLDWRWISGYTGAHLERARPAMTCERTLTMILVDVYSGCDP